MATLSPMRAAVPILDGLPLLHRGKVRDTYDLGLGNLLVVATDAVSIFDFVLNALVPEKGYILTAMTHFWLTFLERKGIRTHMVAAGAGIDPYLPAHLRGNMDLQRRGMVVRKLTMVPVEFIGRNCLTGSVLSQYQKTGAVYGVRLEAGLQDGDPLENMLFTPTDKAEEGHDMPVDADTVRKDYHAETMVFLQAFAEVSAYAKGCGIIMADGKGEIGRDKNGVVRVGDEFGTPDSSRFWDAAAWGASREMETRKAPPPFDKQKVRAWGITLGINKLDPTHVADLATVHGMSVPEDLIAQTGDTYRYIFWRLTGKTLESYTRDELEVMVPFRKKKVAIVAGSESDMPVVSQVVASALNEHRLLSGGVMSYATYVISCHRNPGDLDAFAESGCEGADVVICVGGMALALPGVLDALLYSKGKRIPVIGVALGKHGSRAFLAAVLSIEQLPGNPVLIDEQKERVYSGPEGLMNALLRVRDGEMPPAKDRPHKPALRGLRVSDYLQT